MSQYYFSFWRNSRRCTSLFVGLVLIVTTFPAFAQFKPGGSKAAETINRTGRLTVSQFKPRDRKPASGYSSAGGSRGYSISNGIPITQLAPQTFIGKTASTRPMLVWYMSSSQPVRFRIFELESPTTIKQIGEQKEIPATIGINKLKLPLDYPELAVGKTYLWQIAIDDGNDTIVNRAEFTVINSQLLPKKRFTSIQENVNYYAENELWYEALEEALNATSNGKLGQIASTLVQNLAQSEILIGTQVNIEKTKRRIEYLQKISDEF